jgi:hypothetical protein
MGDNKTTKKILNEATVKRFMKLANIESFGLFGTRANAEDTKAVQEYGSGMYGDREEDLELDVEDSELPPMDAAPEEGPTEELPVDEPLEDEGAEESGTKDDLVDAILDLLAQHADIEVEKGDEEPEAPDMPEEAAEEEAPAEDLPVEEGAGEDLEEGVVSDDGLVEKVMGRVVQRLRDLS